MLQPHQCWSVNTNRNAVKEYTVFFFLLKLSLNHMQEKEKKSNISFSFFLLCHWKDISFCINQMQAQIPPHFVFVLEK